MDGNAKDSTPYANNGTVNSGASLTTDREGQANKAYSFNGSSSAYIDVPSSASLSPTSAVTVTAWFKTTSSSEEYIVSKHDNSFYASISNGGTGKACWYVNNATPLGWLCGTTNVNDGNWHLYSATYDGSSMKVYVDGSLQNSSSRSGSIPTGAASFQIGARSSGYNFNGSIDDVRVYGRALASTEIAAIYKEYNPQLNAASGENGLVGWWKMIGNAKDATPYGNNGTPTAGATLTTDRKGAANSAYSFNGSADISVADNPVLDFTNSFTITSWMKSNSTAAGYVGYITMVFPRLRGVNCA